MVKTVVYILFLFLFPLTFLYPQWQNPLAQDIPPFAVQDITDSNLTLIGQLGIGACLSIETRDNYTYIGNGGLFQILDITDPLNPTLIGEVLLPDGFVVDIEIAGNYAYILGDFKVIDISDPFNPTIVYSETIGAAPMRLKVVGNYLYIGDFSGVIHIIDISTPTQPQQLSTMIASGEIIVGIAVKEPFLYATTVNGFGIDIFNVSDKNSPVYVNYYFTSGLGGAILVNDNFLYEGDSSVPRLKIFDISVPEQPLLIGGLNIQEHPNFISIRDSLAYLSLNDSGFSIVNIIDNSNPQEISNIRPLFLSYGPHSIINDFAYIASGVGFETIDVSSSDSLLRVNFKPTGYSIGNISTQSNYAYCVSSYGGLKIVDYSEPSSPILAGQYQTLSRAMDVAVLGIHAYLVTDTSFIILNIQDPNNPQVLGEVNFQDTLDSPDYVSVILSDSLAIISLPYKYISIIDISNPFKPIILKSFITSMYSFGLAQYKNYIYSAEVDSGLRIYDISCPDSVMEVASIKGLFSSGVHVSGTMLYLAAEGWLSIYDIINPIQPLKLGSVNTPGSRSIVDLSSSNNYIYMAYNLNLEVLDVSNPHNPFITGYLRGTDAFGVDAIKNLVFQGNGGRGLLVLKNDLITSFSEDNAEQIQVFKLFQNYPNPFNPTTTIEYYLAEESKVTLKIYDILGNEVVTLLDGNQKAGYKALAFDASDFASGIYFYRIVTPHYSLTKKMVLIK